MRRHVLPYWWTSHLYVSPRSFSDLSAGRSRGAAEEHNRGHPK